MAYHFKISGEIASEDYWGYDGIFTPQMIDSELITANGEDLLIDIDSIGGCVHSGISIYTKIKRYAKLHNAHVTTRSDGFVASIATIIFLAGDSRIVNEFMQPFVHEPWMWTDATTADDIINEGVGLNNTRKMIAEFYSKHTNISVDEALSLMKNNTWMSADYCLEIGFATEIERLSDADYKIVAKFKNNINQKTKKMSKNKPNWFARAAKILSNHKAALELSDVAGKAIVFPNLETGDVPKKGDAVTVGEDSNFTGVVETDDYVLDVVDGVLASVVDKNEVDKDEVIEGLLEIIENLEESEASAKKENKRLNGIIASLKSGGNPKGTRDSNKDGGDTSDVGGAIAKIRERRKNKK